MAAEDVEQVAMATAVAAIAAMAKEAGITIPDGYFPSKYTKFIGSCRKVACG